jgi:hypothetical protein
MMSCEVRSWAWGSRQHVFAHVQLVTKSVSYQFAYRKSGVGGQSRRSPVLGDLFDAAVGQDPEAPALDEARDSITVLPRDGALPLSAPLSAAQQRLWFLDQFQSGGVEYNAAKGFRLRGRFDVPALSTALSGSSLNRVG